MSSYITSDELKASLELTGETYADADIALAVSAASGAIDSKTKRRFDKDIDATSVRYYTPISRRLIEIDDCVQVAELATGNGDGTFTTIWTPDSQYSLEPFNAAADGEPFTLLRAAFGSFPHRRRRTVRVTGQFGWPAIPDPIKLGTSLLAARLVRRVREAPFGVLTIGLEGMAARIAYSDPDIAQLIDPYVKRLMA